MAATTCPVCVEEGPKWTPRAGEASEIICQPCRELGQRLQRRPLQLIPEAPPPPPLEVLIFLKVKPFYLGRG